MDWRRVTLASTWAPSPARAGQLGCTAFLFWVASRGGLLGPSLTQVRATAFHVAGVGDFLHVDLSWLFFAAALAMFSRGQPSGGGIRFCLAAMTIVQAASYASANLQRYFAGNALAWDLANFVQPMWRAAHGESMAATWSGDHPLWGDHGSFALFLFAPLVRVGSDPATALIVCQSALVAAAAPALFLAARKLGIDEVTALVVAAVVSGSRALANAAAFDFHPECALPVLLFLMVRFRASEQLVWFACVAIMAASLKDGSAMVVAMTAAWLGLRPFSAPVFAVALIAGALACFDVLILPELSGWPSYLQMNSSAEVDPSIAVSTTFGRALTQGGLGWLHPVAWFAGSPWALAAGMSPKLAVKGIDFQYAFLWIPAGAMGAVFVLRGLPTRMRSTAALCWAVLTMSVNAPLQSPMNIGERYLAFKDLHDELARAIPAHESLATDACTAPLVMDRLELVGLCQIDVEALTRDGSERWTHPSHAAFRADTIAIDRTCMVHGVCLQQQISELEKQGYVLRQVVRGRWGVFTRGEKPGR